MLGRFPRNGPSFVLCVLPSFVLCALPSFLLGVLLGVVLVVRHDLDVARV